MASPLTIQPNAASGIDAYVAPGSSTNYGSLNSLYVSNARSTYIKFDLSEIIGKTIDSAILSLWRGGQSGSVNLTIYIKAVTSSWSETTITGVNLPTNESTKYSDTAKGYGVDEWVNFDLKDLVQRYANQEITNYGFLVDTDYSDTVSQYFTSSDSGISAERPKIVIEYSDTREYTKTLTLSDTTATSNIIKSTTKTITNSSLINNTLVKGYLLFKSLLSTIVGTLSGSRTTDKVITNNSNISITGIARSIIKIISETLNITSTSIKNIPKTFSNTCNISNILTKGLLKFKQLSNTVSLTLNKSSSITKIINSIVNLSINMLRNIVKYIVSNVIVNQSLTKSITKIISNTVNLTVNIIKDCLRYIANTLNISTSIIKDIFKTINNNLNLVTNITRNILKNITSTINISLNKSVLILKEMLNNAIASISLITDPTLTYLKVLATSVLTNISLSKNVCKNIAIQVNAVINNLLKNITKTIINSALTTVNTLKYVYKAIVNNINVIINIVIDTTDIFYKVLSNTVTTSNTLVKSIHKSIVNNVNLSINTIKNITKSIINNVHVSVNKVTSILKTLQTGIDTAINFLIYSEGTYYKSFVNRVFGRITLTDIEIDALEAIWQIQCAIYNALAANSALMSLVNNQIYDEPPTDCDYPYIVIGDSEEETLNGLSVKGYSEKVIIRIYTKPAGLGWYTANQILTQINSIINVKRFVMPSYKMAGCMYSNCTTKKDGDKRIIVAEYKVLVQSVENYSISDITT